MRRWVKGMIVTGLAGMTGMATTASAHVHGMAQLDVALQAGRIELALHGAGDNFVGFEHAAQTPEQVAAVHAAEARLRALDELLVVGTGCAGESVTVTLPENLRAAGGAEEKREASHDDHDHHGHHDHDHEDEKDTDTHHPSDWRIEAIFACTHDASGQTLQTRPLFDAFPRLQELRVQAVGANGQAGAALKPDAASLVLP